MQGEFKRKKEEMNHLKVMLEQDLEKSRKDKEYLITNQHQRQMELDEKKAHHLQLVKELKELRLNIKRQN
eukprot:CAMPEP_0202957614 /NCGR_PEP_ID=MMETSP1396-20130829/1989_1 /ASSEMBLY_ACC=CAM_ASM_000872 /TAXON_ID= /ORGANISM="Pseudokeronopsis sp., Strain Brazil" /LENGTH=69 /DNA_ID=CAMNT_0049675189 /DNA_START=541 /DNA_END=750 /DNA_ORIENTATION=-